MFIGHILEHVQYVLLLLVLLLPNLHVHAVDFICRLAGGLSLRLIQESVPTYWFFGLLNTSVTLVYIIGD